MQPLYIAVTLGLAVGLLSNVPQYAADVKPLTVFLENCSHHFGVSVEVFLFVSLMVLALLHYAGRLLILAVSSMPYFRLRQIRQIEEMARKQVLAEKHHQKVSLQ